MNRLKTLERLLYATTCVLVMITSVVVIKNLEFSPAAIQAREDAAYSRQQDSIREEEATQQDAIRGDEAKRCKAVGGEFWSVGYNDPESYAFYVNDNGHAKYVDVEVGQWICAAPTSEDSPRVQGKLTRQIYLKY